MLTQAYHSLQDALAMNGIRRVLWFILVLTISAICFETQTNHFELNAISNRLDMLDKASRQPLSAEQIARIEKLKDRFLDEIEAVQIKRSNPFNQFGKILFRFIKGAWITLPSFWIVIKIAMYLLKHDKSEGLQVKGTMVYFGWLGLSAVAWISTLLGVNSILWNGSEISLVSWIVFPVCSAVALVMSIVWIMLLRSLLPKEGKEPSAPTQVREQSAKI